MSQRRASSALGSAVRRVLSLLGSLALTLAFFLVLPLIQAITKQPDTDLIVTSFDTANLPPPPPPPEDEPDEQEEEEPEPPKLSEEAPPLDLSQLELALSPGFGDGWMEGDFALDLGGIAGGGEEVEGLFSLADLDQKPRVVYQPSPALSAKVRKQAPGTVYVLFVVGEDGRVERPTVQSSTDPVFEKPALDAVKQWKFEPGKRSGKPVRFRMRVPVTFPES